MLKKIITVFISVLFLMSGCSNNTAEINSGEPRQTPQYHDMSVPATYKDDDILLSEVAMVKFSEFDITAPSADIEALQILGELYKPSCLASNLTMSAISVSYSNILTLHYDNVETGEYANFVWNRYVLAENATLDFLGRSPRADNLKEYTEERNEITYAIQEYSDPETKEFCGYSVAWAQHEQAFGADLSASFTLEEVLAFCDAQSVNAWELQGDAVSVSIQGMSDMNIYDGDNNTIIVEDDVLYRVNNDGMSATRSINMTSDGSNVTNSVIGERIGYRWLIDESATRYQYVLEPGVYEFQAEIVTIKPELLVKHFEAGEVVSEVNYTETLAEQSLTQFSLNVTPDPADNALTTNSDLKIKLSQSETVLKKGDYFTINAFLTKEIESNVAILDFKFDMDKVTYVSHTLPEGTTLISAEPKDMGMRFVPMVANYKMKDLVTLTLQAKKTIVDNIELVSVIANIVERTGADKKVLTLRSLLNFDPKDDPEYVTFDLIYLSNVIDAFGKTKNDADWGLVSRYDWNNSGIIDISDIAYAAAKIDMKQTA